jgi:protein PhnA
MPEPDREERGTGQQPLALPFGIYVERSSCSTGRGLAYADEMLAWAKATGDHESDGTVDLHKDSNGNILQNGDTVVLTKSLDVKGSSLNARMGTVVKNIRLVPDNTGQIEGKVEGQTIVILTKFLRKQNA